jgi:hypothetical protein
MLRGNIRNYCVGLSLSEIRTMLTDAVTRGEQCRAGYIEEYLCEVEEEEESCDDVTIPLSYF